VAAAANLPPVIDSVNADPQFIFGGTSAGITVFASDPDGDQITYQYSATNGSITGSGPSVIFNAPDVSADEVVTVNVTVSDIHGNSSQGYTEVTVHPYFNLQEIENNDERAQSQHLSGLNFKLSGNIGVGGDNDGDQTDFYILDAVQPGSRFKLTLTYNSTLSDLSFEIVNEDFSIFQFGQGDGDVLELGMVVRSLEPGPYYVVVANYTGNSDYELVCEELKDYDEVEDNDSAAEATPLPGFDPDPDWLFWTGTLGPDPDDPAGDGEDWLQFSPATGDDIHFDVYFDPSLGNIGVKMLDANGNVLETSDDLGGVMSIGHVFVAGEAAPAYLKLALTSGYTPYWINGYLFN
jgi:hypothetical protein